MIGKSNREELELLFNEKLYKTRQDLIERISLKADKNELIKLQRDKIEQMNEKQLEQESFDDLKNQILSLNRLFEGFSQSLTEEIIYSKKKTEKALENALNENQALGKRLSEVESLLKKHFMQERISSQNDVHLSQGSENEVRNQRRATSQDSIEKESTPNVFSSNLDDVEEENVKGEFKKAPKSPLHVKRKKTLSENASPTHLIGKISSRDSLILD